SAFLTSIGDINIKMFRPALAGALSAFVLLICIQLNARVACTPPQPDAAAKVAAGAPSSSEAQSFVDVSASAGISDSLNKSWGSPVWGDMNNDGNIDVLVSTHGVAGTNRPFIYLNNGNGTF